jgi:Family of unknown function (DUF6804)
MYSRLVKCTCLVALALTAVVTREGMSTILLQFILCGGALFVMIEAVRNRKYIWVAAFAVLVMYFNPIFPVELPRWMALAILILCALVFLGSLRYLGTQPRMSLATITDLPARGESL